MACRCRNSDGSLSMMCHGQCVGYPFAQDSQTICGHSEILSDETTEFINKLQKEEDKKTKDTIEYTLSVFLAKLDDRIKGLEKSVIAEYKKGFAEGFKFAQDNLDKGYDYDE